MYTCNDSCKFDSFAGNAVHASQQLQKQAAMSNSSGSQRVGSRLKAAMDMSGERISGFPQSPSGSSSNGSSPGDAAWSSDYDDVELEKSNILMLGPTGGFMVSINDRHYCVQPFNIVVLSTWVAVFVVHHRRA